MDQQPLDPAETVNLEFEEPLQQEQTEKDDPEPDPEALYEKKEAEADPSKTVKESEQAGSKPDSKLESGLKLLTTVTEKSKSDFVASFSNDQQMIRDYVASASKMATVILNPSSVVPAAFSVGEQIIVEVSEDKYYLVTVEDTSRDRKIDFVRGQVEGSDFGFFHMTTTEGQTMAVLRVPEENKVYHIVYSNSGRYQLFEFAIDEFEQYESLPSLIPEEHQPLSQEELKRGERKPVADQPATAGSSDPNDPATIDVMVAYTPAAQTWAGAQCHGQLYRKQSQSIVK